MDEGIRDLPNDQMYKLMKRLIILFNMWSFRFEDIIKEMNINIPYDNTIPLGKEFSQRQAQGIKNQFNIKPNLDGIMQALKYSHWFLLEDAYIEKLNNNLLIFYIKNCTSWRYFEKLGRADHPCSQNSLIVRSEFVKVICPEAEVKVIHAPDMPIRPEELEKDISCYWEISLSNPAD